MFPSSGVRDQNGVVSFDMRKVRKRKKVGSEFRWRIFMNNGCRTPFFAVERQNMVETQVRARGHRDGRLLDAMATVPRHEFVNRRPRPSL